MFKLDLEKEPEIKSPTSIGSQKKQENSRKTSIYFCFIDYAKAFVWITTNCGLFVSAGDSSTQTGKSGSVSYGVTRKGRFSFQPQKKGNVKECSNYDTTAVISHASKASQVTLVVKNPSANEGDSRDGKTRPPDLPLEKSVCRSRSNSQNWTWNNRLVPNRKTSSSRLYIVTRFI